MIELCIGIITRNIWYAIIFFGLITLKTFLLYRKSNKKYTVKQLLSCLVFYGILEIFFRIFDYVIKSPDDIISKILHFPLLMLGMYLEFIISLGALMILANMIACIIIYIIFKIKPQVQKESNYEQEL